MANCYMKLTDKPQTVNNLKCILCALVLLTLTTFIGSSQTFLTKYSKLTKKNLYEFFFDWKSYSDSINSNNTISDSIIRDIVMWNNLTVNLEGYYPNKPKYNVIPQIIEVERYYLDVDTIMARLCLGFPEFIEDLKEEKCVVDSVTPFLPLRSLYLTSDIDKKLSSFVGGLKCGDKMGKINKNNIKKLKKYIPVDYGHWGGYWWFISFPIITHIFYADNLIAVMRRTSWWTGDVIWYVKENGQFVRRSDPVTTWVE